MALLIGSAALATQARIRHCSLAQYALAAVDVSARRELLRDCEAVTAEERCAMKSVRWSTSRSISRRATTRGISDCVWCPTMILFRAIQSGKASVVLTTLKRLLTEGCSWCRVSISTLSHCCVRTGLELVLLGGAEFTLDGEPIDLANEWTYKGMMCSNVPNMVHTFGYINASWTLRADLIATWVCAYSIICVRPVRNGNPAYLEELAAVNEPSDFGSTIFPLVTCSDVMHRFPRQGDQMPWMNPQDYRKDRKMFRDDPIDDECTGVLRRQSCASSAALERGESMTLIRRCRKAVFTVPTVVKSIEVLLNPEDVGVDYIEDCQVCCRPIEFVLREAAGGWLEAEVRSDSNRVTQSRMFG